MKKTITLIFAVLFLAVQLISVSAQEKGIPSVVVSEPALYVHAVSSSDDTEAWHKWQSIHDEDFQEEKPNEKYFFLPSSAGKNSVDVYNGYDEEVILNGVKIPSHTTEPVPYEAGVSYSVTVGTDSYTLTLMNSNAEAAIYINNPDADGSGLDLISYLGVDKSRSAAATGAIVTPDGSIDNTGIKKIKGRGNTSWEKPKKSYNITYDKDVVIAGMDKTKKVAIVANYQDDSLSRNRILYDLSDAVGLPYAPDSRYVDFYANGYYWGSYLLSEKIDSGSLLPKIENSDYLNDDNTIKENFDFVVEVNPSAGDDDYWFNSNGMKITIVSPEIDPGEPGYDEVKKHVKEKFDHFYAATSSSGNLSETADIESLAGLYLINELGKNWDSGAASTFFTCRQDNNGVYKFYGSPVWDYDNSMGNATGVLDDLRSIGLTDYEEYTGWWCQHKGKSGAEDQQSDNIIARISQHPEIQAAVPVIWFEEFMPALEHFAGNQYNSQIETELKTRDEYFDLIQDSAQMNYASGWLLRTSPWIADHSALNKAIYDPATQKMIIDAAVTNYEQVFADMFNYAADWMLSRAAWLSEQFAHDYLIDDKDTPVCPGDDTCPITPFTDTDRNEWYHDGVHWALEKAIMNGTSDSTFEPMASTTRAMIVTMLWRMEGSPQVDGNMAFKDVPDGQWYTDAIRWAALNGIVTGYDEDTFGTNDSVTREQLATILYRSAQSKGQGFTGAWSFPLNFKDADQVSEWADEAMHWMTMNGIIQGVSDRELSPQDDAVRAQVATMLMRFNEKIS